MSEPDPRDIDIEREIELSETKSLDSFYVAAATPVTDGPELQSPPSAGTSAQDIDLPEFDG